MKTRVLYLFAAVLVLFSCTNENIATVLPDTDEFYCSIENEEPTRTSLDQNNNVIWSAEDQLVIFKKSSIPSKYQISESHVGKTSGSFYKVNSDEFNAGSELDHNVALYPYQENVEITKLDSDSPTSSYKITGYNFPAEQTYVENSFANGAFPMAAVSDNYDLTFRNICGGIKLQLKGTQKVISIKIEGKNSEKLAGNADVIVYSDEALKPVITLASGASSSVTLNCSTGVQLNKITATEFVITLPPVLFNKGFTVTITDSDGKTYTVETDRANTVIRSSLLIMPKVLITESSAEPEDDIDDIVIPVSSITLNSSSLELYIGDVALLEVTSIKPTDATDRNVIWSSDAPAVAYVDYSGNVTALSAGTAKISASAGGKSASCKVTVSPWSVATVDYIDEYGVNHGKGIAIGMAVWAPVNCGYHSTDYKYGKLYQWGRKYGQGYSGELYVNFTPTDEKISDAAVPTISEGGVSLVGGQHSSNANAFFVSTKEYNYDWVHPQDGTLWNSGSEKKPAKTEYDPCPSGWRVPTREELDELSLNYSEWTTNSVGQGGYWFSGPNTYSELVPRVFFPAAGQRDYDGVAVYRNGRCSYWSSSSYRDNASQGACRLDGTGVYNCYGRAFGFAIRCVQE